jgi:hypothetical protein
MSGKAREASTYRAANRNYARLLREVKRVFSEPSREVVTSTTSRAVPAKPLRKISWREAVHFARQELHGNMAKRAKKRH